MTSARHFHCRFQNKERLPREITHAGRRILATTIAKATARTQPNIKNMKLLCFHSSIPTFHQFPDTDYCKQRWCSRLRTICEVSRQGGADGDNAVSSARDVLGLKPGLSSEDLKAAFRSKVKQFHPDVNRAGDADVMIRRVIHAYEMLSYYSRSEIIESECLDPFDKPECEAFDVFVNELLCVGKTCPYPCVKRAPHAFTFSTAGGTARATSQGNEEDYDVQVAVGQCPRSCIHYVTPSQRIILEELLDSIMDVPYDTSAEADLLYSLIVKAKFENNRYRGPKKPPARSTKHVDWY